MTAAVFEARYNRILRGREQGYEELSDFLGRKADLGPLVRLGLLRRREENSEYQRYHGYVPTHAADEMLPRLFRKERTVELEKAGNSLWNVRVDGGPARTVDALALKEEDRIKPKVLSSQVIKNVVTTDHGFPYDDYDHKIAKIQSCKP